MKFLLPLLLVVATASAVPIQVTYTDGANTGFFDPAPRSAAGSNPGTTLGQQRRIAFEYAASRWSSQIKGSIPIKVTAGWASTAPGGNGIITMASASPQNFFKNGGVVSGLPKNNTFYPSALVDQVMGQDLVLNGTSNDVSVNCNSYPDEITSDGFSWNYDLSNSGAGSSFVGAILHELAHGFGFIATLDQNGNYGMGSPTTWDTLATDGAGTFLTTMSAANRAPLRTSDNVFADGPTLRLYNNGNPAKVHAPTTYSGGSSLHHFDETTYSTAGNINELQTPMLSFPTQAFGPLVTSAMRDMGYTMADELPPVADITSPAPGKIYTSAALAAAGISGTTTDTAAGGNANAVGLLRTKVALYSSSQGKWYRWSTPGFDSGPFDYANHTKEATIENLLPIATGSHTWGTTLPAGLPDGSYELHVSSVDQNDQGSSFISNPFTIDNTAPGAVIEPWTITSPPLFNLDPLKVLAPDATTVKIELRRTVGADTFFWSGTNWSTTPTQLATTQNAGRWSLNLSPPNRQNWPQGQAITIRVIATDGAANQTITNLAVTRTAADSSLPVVSFNSPASGSVLTVPNLPSLQGMASDPESGIASVTLNIARFIAGGGVEFWSGTDWSASSTNLPVIHDAASGQWTAPAGWNLPSGSALANGNYSIQVSATNREIPAGTTGAGVSFSVDYHPVYTWTGATLRDDNYTNDSRSWGVPENWSPYGIPDVNDKVVIANGDEVTSTISRSVYGMTLASGYLNFLNGPGPLGTLTSSHGSEWNGGTLNGIWDNSGSIQINGNVEHWLLNSGRINNSGTVSHNGGVIVGRQDVIITNLPGATWILATAGDVFSNYNGGNQFINQGIFRHTAANDSELNDWSYTLGGEVQKHGAVLVLRANATLPSGMQFTGAGGFRIIDGTVSASGPMTNAAGLFQHAGGTLATTAPVTLNGNYTWSGGAFAGNFTLPAGADLSITGQCQFNPNSVFNNSGTVHWTTPNPLVGIQDVTVNNQPGGVWRLESTGDALANYNGGNAFNNFGRLEKVGSGQTMLRHWTYSNSAEIKATAGVLYVAASSSTNAGTLLSGAGTIQMADGTWTVSAPITSTVATLKFTGGTMSCGPTAKIHGNWTWNGGAMSGSLEVPASTQLTFDGSSQLNPGATLVNKGTGVWQGTSPILGVQDVVVTNAPGATWKIAASGAPFANYNGGNSFTNQGSFQRTVSSGDVVLHSWTYNQAASFEAVAGGDTIINAPLNLLEGSSFNGAGKFVLVGQTWLKGACTFAGTTIEHSGPGILHGEAAGQIKGTLRWVSGSMDGIVKVANLAILKLSSANGRSLGASSTIDCSGSLVWEGGELQGIQDSTIRIRGGASMTIESAAAFTNYNGGNHLVIDDGGSLLKTSAGDSQVHWAFDNDGSATVNNGMLMLFGGGSGDGVFTGNAPGVLRFSNGGHVLEGGASLVGNVEITDGSLLASGAAGGRLAVKGGTAGGGAGGIFDFTTGSTWTGGNINGQTRIPSGHSLIVSSPNGKELTSGAVMEVQGLLQWDGGYPIQGHGSSTIDLKSSGIFRATADGDLFANYNGGNRLLLNGGTFEKSAGSLSTWLDEWAVEGNGIIRAQQGKIDFQTEATLNAGTQFQGTGRTRFNTGNVNLRGSSTIQAGVTLEFSAASVNAHADGTATLTGGLIEWSGGTINGTLTLNSTTTLTGPNEKWLGPGAQLRNGNQMSLGGTGALVGRQDVRLINLASGTLNCPGGLTCGNYNDGNKLVNEGTMVLGNPLGRQTMHWYFQQTSSGSLAVEVSGANAAIPEFDCLLSYRGVQLDGTLVVTKTGGYLPPDGTTFDVVTGTGGVSGKFATMLAPDMKAEYSSGALTLRATTLGITYGEWASAEGLSGANALATADPDGDGVPNALEYAFHTNPKQRSAPPVTHSIITVGNQKWLTVHYRRWQDRIDAGIGYYPERSPNLSLWNADGITDEVDPAAPVVAGSEARRCRVLIAPSPTKELLRVRVE